MPKIDILDVKGNVVGDVELSEGIFGIEPNEYVVHEVVVALLANRRQGTRSAKTRSEVRGGGRKPWKQKGTGRARAGTIRSPLWKGGGVIFAPKSRDYSKKVNKKVKALAMKSVFSAKAQENEIRVLNQFVMDVPKTKEMIAVLKNINAEKALIVLPENNNSIFKSANNIPKIATITVNELNVYDMLKYDVLIMTQEALEKIEEVYA